MGNLCNKDDLREETKSTLETTFSIKKLKCRASTNSNASNSTLGECGVILAFKDDSSYINVQPEYGLSLVDKGKEIYAAELPNNDFNDVICVKGVYYISEASTGIWLKSADSSKPELFKEIPGLTGSIGRVLRAGYSGQVLFAMKNSQSLIAMRLDLEKSMPGRVYEDVIEEITRSGSGSGETDGIHAEESDLISDYQVFGEEGDCVVVLQKSGRLAAYQYFVKRRRSKLLLEHEIKMIKNRPERASALAVCPKNEYFAVFTDSKDGGEYKCSRAILLQLKEGKIVERGTINLHVEEFIPFIYHVVFQKYYNDYLVFSAFNGIEEAMLQTFCYDKKKKEFYEIRKLRKHVDVPFPGKLVTCGDSLYSSDPDGTLVEISYYY